MLIEMGSPLNGVDPNHTQWLVSLLGEDIWTRIDTEKATGEDRGRDGRDVAMSPGTPGAQKLEEAGRTFSWSLRREHGPAPPGSQRSCPSWNSILVPPDLRGLVSRAGRDRLSPPGDGI